MEQFPAIFGDMAALALGACVGSFAVTVAYRLPRDISIATPRSFCESCERPIPWWANIPIFAYLSSRGRCLMCGAPISARHLGGELALALAALFLYTNFPLGDAIARFVFITALMTCSLVDYDWRLIPNLITFPGVPVGFVLASIFMPEVGWKNSLIGITAGGGVLFVTGFLYQMVRGQEGVGLGDVFLLAMVGAFIGWQGTLFTLFFGALLGSFGGLAVGLFGTPRDAPELPPSMREAAGTAAPGASSVAGGQASAATVAVAQNDAAAALSIDSQAPDSAAAESEEHTLLATAVPFGPFLSAAAGFYALFQPQLASWYLSR
jgi:leader peptidase (prepilin peptidase)/N-methyltransferase